MSPRRVVDLTTSIAGAYCSHLLAATGAEITVFEAPDTHHIVRTTSLPWGSAGA